MRHSGREEGYGGIDGQRGGDVQQGGGDDDDREWRQRLVQISVRAKIIPLTQVGAY